jgi:FMN-dependent NADH-azoreductase
MLVLEVSANPKPIDESNSLQLKQEFERGLKQTNENALIKEINLYQNQPPYYSYEHFRYFWYPVFFPHYKPSDKEIQAVEYSLEQIKTFNSADILVIACPMWNFSVPAILKAWLDQIIVPGHTYTWDENGNMIKRHKLRKCILLVSSGGVYYKRDPKDQLSSLIKSDLNFLLVDDISVIWADGQNPLLHMDQEERRENALKLAFEMGVETGKIKL